MAQALKRRARKDQRLEARVTRHQKRLIERAAELRGTTVTEFLVVSAQEAAAETIRNHEILVLRDEARDVFIDALLNPPAPNEALRSAGRRYRSEMGI